MTRFLFDRFELDPPRRRLLLGGEPLAISDRQFDVLLLLVERAGHIVAKEDLLQYGWKDVAVGDNSLEQVISSLRRVLGGPAGRGCIETVARRGYRFCVPVTRMAHRETDAALDALLAPHRAFIEGRAALESLQAERVVGARQVFETVVNAAPDDPSAHIGLANAHLMQFEMTRASPSPDTASLVLAGDHAREACRLDPQSGEAWATLGFVLDRVGSRDDARAAARHAVALEPDNWRHHFRLSSVSWGEDRLRAAHRTLVLLPDFPLARWLAATVHVARQALNEAERELGAGVEAQRAESASGSRFTAVALHWLLGLIHLARGDQAGALEAFDRELSYEHTGQLYARECAANTWYAIGALKLRQGQSEEAGAAFRHALERVPTHPMARMGLSTTDGILASASPDMSAPDETVAQAARLVLAGAHGDAARIVSQALAEAPPGNAAWLLPVEPLLQVADYPGVWAHALAQLRNRAS